VAGVAGCGTPAGGRRRRRAATERRAPANAQRVDREPVNSSGGASGANGSGEEVGAKAAGWRIDSAARGPGHATTRRGDLPALMLDGRSVCPDRPPFDDPFVG
jgi:hypothetical protein